MENELSINSRARVTTKYAKAYVKAAKGDKGQILHPTAQDRNHGDRHPGPRDEHPRPPTTNPQSPRPRRNHRPRRNPWANRYEAVSPNTLNEYMSAPVAQSVTLTTTAGETPANDVVPAGASDHELAGVMDGVPG